MFLLDSVGDLGRMAKEVKVLSNLGSGAGVAAKSIVVEDVVGFVELVAEAIVSIFKLEGVVADVVAAGEASKGIVGLGEARCRGVVAAATGVKAKK